MDFTQSDILYAENILGLRLNNIRRQYNRQLYDQVLSGGGSKRLLQKLGDHNRPPRKKSRRGRELRRPPAARNQKRKSQGGRAPAKSIVKRVRKRVRKRVTHENKKYSSSLTGRDKPLNDKATDFLIYLGKTHSFLKNFYDLGAGKGELLLRIAMARTQKSFVYEEVAGVELEPLNVRAFNLLAETVHSGLRRAEAKDRIGSINLQTGNILNFENREPNTLYFCNNMLMVREPWYGNVESVLKSLLGTPQSMLVTTWPLSGSRRGSYEAHVFNYGETTTVTGNILRSYNVTLYVYK